MDREGRMKRLGPSALVVVASVMLSCAAPGATTQPSAAAPQPTRVVGAQDEGAAPQPPAEFTGIWCIGPEVAPDRAGTETTLEVGDGGLVLTRNRGGAWRNAVAMSDPRLQGDAYQTYETDSYADGPRVDSSTMSIVNEDGAWVARRYRTTGALAESTDTGTVFIGEGAYDGLIAFMSDHRAPVQRPEEVPPEYEGCEAVRGVIIDGAVAESYRPE
jgi:hypothetical protein